MNAIRRDGYKSPVSHIIIVLCLTLGLSALPIQRLTDLFIGDKLVSAMVSTSVLRIILSVVAGIFIYVYGFNKLFKNTFGIKGYLLSIPALIIAVNNFPIIGVITGNVTVFADGNRFLLYVFYCVSVGIYEETTFRGLIFPLCVLLFKDKKCGLFWAVFLSSALFGLSHLMNLFGGAQFGVTVLQIGYSFLIGAMCAISMLMTGNIYCAILLHTVYDIGGLILEPAFNVAIGNQWDTATVIITAVLGVAVTVIYVLYTLRKKDKSFINLLVNEENNVCEKQESSDFLE